MFFVRLICIIISYELIFINSIRFVFMPFSLNYSDSVSLCANMKRRSHGPIDRKMVSHYRFKTDDVGAFATFFLLQYLLYIFIELHFFFCTRTCRKTFDPPVWITARSFTMFANSFYSNGSLHKPLSKRDPICAQVDDVTEFQSSLTFFSIFSLYVTEQGERRRFNRFHIKIVTTQRAVIQRFTN